MKGGKLEQHRNSKHFGIERKDRQSDSVFDFVKVMNTAKAKTLKPKTIKPKTLKLKTLKLKTLKPKTFKPKTLNPKTLKPKTFKPKTLKPKTLNPKTLKPKTLKPHPNNVDIHASDRWQEKTSNQPMITFAQRQAS